MPSHQDRREPLPEWYQFGDAGGSFLETYRVERSRWARVRPVDVDALRRVALRNVTEGDRDIMDRYDHVLDGLEF